VTSTHSPLHDLVGPAGLPARFAVERPLGAGGFGTVYRAYDRERRTTVALKQLTRVDPASLYRFKQEFRALADLHHPNLVRLHELFAVEGTWCFTMELIEGVRFDLFVHGAAIGPAAAETVGKDATQPRSASTQPAVALPASAPRPDHPLDADVGGAAPPFPEERLRHALRGLVSGILALHGAGILHRDLKPSNVLVDRDGRVVILDFGLVATGVVDAHQSTEGGAAGTPAYMSPEQARGAPLTAASDFYTLGLMLYEALAGQPPFSGSAADMLAARATRAPRDPRTLRPGLPEDLCDLCLALLARDPEARPRAPELARRLGLPAETVAAGLRPGGGGVEATFVGREAELDVLGRALDRTRQGRPTAVYVHGASGIGKTALVRRFLTVTAAQHAAVVLEGRCFDRESVPYKALDEIVDALGRYLRRLPRLEAAGLLPRDARALLRLFPTLGQSDLFATAPGRDPAPDPHELRRRAFRALRELLARLTDVRPVVLSIDDVQWGDADSAALLEALLAPPDPPPLLFLLGLRADDPGVGDIPRALRRSAPSAIAHDNVDLPLLALPRGDAERLAAHLLGDEGALASHAVRVALESGGSPLFVGELARALAAGQRSPEDVSLQDVLARRVAALSTPARRILESLACAGRPQDEAMLAAIARVDPADLALALERLRREHLVGMGTLSGRPTFELLHDQVRTSVLTGLPPEEARAYHLRLGEHLERVGGADPETLAHHFFEANRPERAVPHAERAGERASGALAFEHAAALFGRALDAAAPADRDRIRLKLAGALASAGRGVDAAAAYLACAEGRQGQDRLELLRHAAAQLLRAGRLQEGLETIRPVLEDAGIDMPRSPRRALISVLWRRSWLKLRGFKYVERPEAEVPAADLRGMDLCWALGGGLVGVDQVRSADFQARHLLLALDAGEPYRIGRALAYESILASLENHEGLRRGAALAARAEELARRFKHPHALAWARAAAGLGAWSQANFPRCLELLDEATALFRDHGGDVFRELATMEIWFSLHVRFLLGRLEDVALRAAACVAEARARGDRYGETTARAYIVPLVWLAVDRPTEARREAEEAIRLWGHGGCQHQHWAELRAQCCIDLYEGKGAEAVARIERTRKAMKESLLLRMRTPRLEHRYLEARGLIDAAWATTSPGALLKRIERAARALESERNGLADAYAGALRAGVAARGGDRETTRAAFHRAELAFQAISMPLYAAAARRRGAELLEGDDARATIASCDAALAAAGVADPVRFARFLVPRALA
jgi:hypothetical protein